ncbi:MAG TPA: hypothetical protein VF136_00395 [Methylomirabilota bacterium]
MSQAHGDLGRRLAALRSDFAALGARAAGAAEALAATLPPPTPLLDELTAAREAFAGLRTAMVEQAATLSIPLEADGLGTLQDLEPVLAAIAAAEEHRAQLAAWDAARKEALGLLGRVLALVHREDKTLPTLADCQARARELHVVLAGPAPDDLERATALLPDKMRPYTDLLTLVEGWNVLDDERCAVLQDSITESFGRPLALATLRGKIGREGDTPPAAPAGRTRKRATARAPMEPAPPVPAPDPVAAVPPPPRVAPAPAAAAPPRVAPPQATVTPSPPPMAPPAPPAPLRIEPPPPSPVPVSAADLEPTDQEDAVPDDVGSSEEPTAEAAALRREQEEQLERLAQETARWWLTARAGWHGLRERGLTFGDAAHDYLQRFPHLLSVPLQQSAEYEAGRLAEGYALLLAHIDRQEPGFVNAALTRLNPQLGTRDKDEVYPLGQELYLYVVAEARLYKTYPDFVREVIAHAVPRPGAWVQGGIVEADDETRLFMRSEQPGSSQEQTRTLQDGKERLGPHLFQVTLSPLTTRFFTVRLAGEALSDPPNVEIKLKENDAPTDHAWLITLPVADTAPVPAPRKHRTGGTTLEELGNQFGGFWMAVFNADPRHDRHYELSIILRRKPAPVSGPHARPASGPDRFFGKR